MNDLATVITALAALVAAIGTVINIYKTNSVKNEVKTGNSQTLAQLADATEVRRIDKIPEVDRTSTEKSHQRAVKE